MGTQSIKFSNNQVHLVELNEETGNLKTQVFQHSIGEIWSIQASPTEPDVFITCYNSLSGKSNQIQVYLIYLHLEILFKVKKKREYISIFNDT